MKTTLDLTMYCLSFKVSLYTLIITDSLVLPSLFRLYGMLLPSVISCIITRFQGYLKALGMKRTAQVKRDARIGEAEARKEAGIKVSVFDLVVLKPIRKKLMVTGYMCVKFIAHHWLYNSLYDRRKCSCWRDLWNIQFRG